MPERRWAASLCTPPCRAVPGGLSRAEQRHAGDGLRRLLLRRSRFPRAPDARRWDSCVIRGAARREVNWYDRALPSNRTVRPWHARCWRRESGVLGGLAATRTANPLSSSTVAPAQGVRQECVATSIRKPTGSCCSTSAGVAGVRRTPVTWAPIFRSIRLPISWRTWSSFDSTWILTNGCGSAVLGVLPLGSPTPNETRHASQKWSSAASPPHGDQRSTGSIVVLHHCSRHSGHASARRPPGGTRWRSRRGLPPPAAGSRSCHAHEGGKGLVRVGVSLGVGGPRGQTGPAAIAARVSARVCTHRDTLFSPQRLA